jgi:hypothetical protein
MDDPNKGYLFRIEVDNNGRKSEIYLDLFQRNFKANTSNVKLLKNLRKIVIKKSNLFPAVDQNSKNLTKMTIFSEI